MKIVLMVNGKEIQPSDIKNEQELKTACLSALRETEDVVNQLVRNARFMTAWLEQHWDQ